MRELQLYAARRHLTITALAGEIGVSRSTISRVLASKRNLSVSLMLKIETATGIPRRRLRPDLYPAVTRRSQ